MQDQQNLYYNSFKYFVPSPVPGCNKSVALAECIDFLGALAAAVLSTRPA